MARTNRYESHRTIRECEIQKYFNTVFHISKALSITHKGNIRNIIYQENARKYITQTIPNVPMGCTMQTRGKTLGHLR